MITRKGLGRILLGAGLLLSGGCAHYALVEGGETVTLSGCCTLKSPMAWSRATSGKREYWTVDGPRLEQVVFLKGIEAGEPLFAVEPDPGQPVPPRFEAGLDDTGMRRLLHGALESMGVVKPRQFRYLGSPFGGMQGFRVSFAFVGSDGLERLGLVVGTEKLGRLYLLFYHGDAVHHFHQYLPAVEEMIQSVRFVEGGWFDFSSTASGSVGSSGESSSSGSSAPRSVMESEEVVIEHRPVVPP